jgi:5,10-methylenetetrahydromethanopterin reductase
LIPGPDVVEQARWAESLGYRRAWLFDSPAIYGDIWIGLARVAEGTRSIGLGTAVIVPSLRHVLVTAAAIASIESLAPGRLHVAIGTGFSARYMLGQKPLTWRWVERYVAQLRALLGGEDALVDGALVRLCQHPSLAPARPMGTPLVIAANAPKGLDVARRVGDGVMCVQTPQAGFARSVLLLFGTVLDDRETFTSPRVRAAIEPAIAAVYHGTYEAAPAAVDALPGGQAWREAIERVPAERRHLVVHEGHFFAVPERERALLSLDLAPITFSGTRAELRERLAGYVAAGMTEALYVPMGPDIERELRAMAEAAGLR